MRWMRVIIIGLILHSFADIGTNENHLSRSKRYEDGTAVDDNNSTELTLCPSSECWEFNSELNTCLLKDNSNCKQHVCLHDKMVITFSSLLFGEVNASIINPTPTNVNGSYVIECPFGTCNMEYHQDFNGQLIFTVPVWLDVETNNTEGSSNTIDLANMTVRTSSSGVEIQFVCEYPNLVTLKDDYYSYTSSILGVSAETGSLQEGFSMVIGNNQENATKLAVGDDVDVCIKWSVTSLPKIHMFIKDCVVEQVSSGSFYIPVPIIKNGCFSSALSVEPSYGTMNGTEHAFRYMSFMADNTIGGYNTAVNQTLECTAVLCMGSQMPTYTSECAQLAFEDTSCPSANSLDIGLKYKAVYDLPSTIWASWTDWSTCSLSCAGGSRTRTRICAFGMDGLIECSGEDEEVDDCNSHTCPYWDNWSTWEDCSATCGGGFQSQFRDCINGTIGEDGCDDLDTQSRTCNTNSCPFLTTWTGWNSCTADPAYPSNYGEICQCRGITTRSRTCEYGNPGDKGCEGDLTDTNQCGGEQTRCLMDPSLGGQRIYIIPYRYRAEANPEEPGQDYRLCIHPGETQLWASAQSDKFVSFDKSPSSLNSATNQGSGVYWQLYYDYKFLTGFPTFYALQTWDDPNDLQRTWRFQNFGNSQNGPYQIFNGQQSPSKCLAYDRWSNSGYLQYQDCNSGNDHQMFLIESIDQPFFNC